MLNLLYLNAIQFAQNPSRVKLAMLVGSMAVAILITGDVQSVTNPEATGGS